MTLHDFGVALITSGIFMVAGIGLWCSLGFKQQVFFLGYLTGCAVMLFLSGLIALGK